MTRLLGCGKGGRYYPPRATAQFLCRITQPEQALQVVGVELRRVVSKIDGEGSESLPPAPQLLMAAALES